MVSAMPSVVKSVSTLLPSSDPAATIRKMQAVRAAALAAEQVDPEEETQTAADNLPTAAEEAPLPGTLVDIRA